MARRFEGVQGALRVAPGWASSTLSGPGDPWAGCVPAEPASVSPGDNSVWSGACVGKPVRRSDAELAGWRLFFLGHDRVCGWDARTFPAARRWAPCSTGWARAAAPCLPHVPRQHHGLKVGNRHSDSSFIRTLRRFPRKGKWRLSPTRSFAESRVECRQHRVRRASSRRD